MNEFEKVLITIQMKNDSETAETCFTVNADRCFIAIIIHVKVRLVMLFVIAVQHF